MKLEMARHFELCDSDKDGYISFSQFLRWVELCDLDPEDHLEVGRVPFLRRRTHDAVPYRGVPCRSTLCLSELVSCGPVPYLTVPYLLTVTYHTETLTRPSEIVDSSCPPPL